MAGAAPLTIFFCFLDCDLAGIPGAQASVSGVLMTVTGVNTVFPDKVRKTVLNCVREDTGKILDGFYVERKLEAVSGKADLYLCFCPSF